MTSSITNAFASRPNHDFSHIVNIDQLPTHVAGVPLRDFVEALAPGAWHARRVVEVLDLDYPGSVTSFAGFKSTKEMLVWLDELASGEPGLMAYMTGRWELHDFGPEVYTLHGYAVASGTTWEQFVRLDKAEHGHYL